MTPATGRPPVPVLLFVALLVLLWGGNSPGIKVALTGVPPMWLSVIRFGLGLLMVGGWSLIAGRSLALPRREVPAVLLLALVFFAQTLGLTVGTDWTLAAHSAVAMSTFPFFTAMFAHVMLPGDRLSWSKLVGILVAFGGIALTFGGEGGSGASLLGDLTVLASSALLGFRTALSKRVMETADPMRTLFWMLAISLAPYGVLAAVLESNATLHFTPAVVVALAHIGVVVAGFCFIAWMTMLQRYSASRLTVLFFAQPILGVVVSWAFLGEPLGINLAIGTGCVALGIWIVNRPEFLPALAGRIKTLVSLHEKNESAGQTGRGPRSGDSGGAGP